MLFLLIVIGILYGTVLLVENPLRRVNMEPEDGQQVHDYLAIAVRSRFGNPNDKSQMRTASRWFIVNGIICLIVLMTLSLIGYDYRLDNLKTGEPFLVKSTDKSGSIFPSADGTQTTQAPTIKEYTQTDIDELVKITNDYRKENGLSLVEVDALLTKSAQLHAEDMYENKYFSHTDPEGFGPKERLDAYIPAWEKSSGKKAPVYLAIGENLYQNNVSLYAAPKDAMDAWIKSESHKEILDYPGWDRIGIAVYQVKTSPEVVIWVQIFGKTQ